MVVSNIVFFGKNKIKYFIGYKDVEKIDLYDIPSKNEQI